MVQDEQQIVPFLMNPPQGLIQVLRTGPPLGQSIEVPLQASLSLRRRCFPVGAQTLVVFPHGVANL